MKYERNNTLNVRLACNKDINYNTKENTNYNNH